VKIDADTGVILGEYRTHPTLTGGSANPSRTTVDQDGSVWVANRGGSPGSVTHVGLFENGQCEDRNNNGSIETSTGLGNVLGWTTSAGPAPRGVGDAADECIVHHTSLPSNPSGGTRHISVDGNNDVWVSSTGNRTFDLLKGGKYDVPASGTIIRSEPTVGFGGYGGLIDPSGVIWSARNLLRWDTTNPLIGPNGDPAGQSIGPPAAGTNWSGQGGDSYGLCINPNNGEVWNTQLSGNAIHRYAPDGTHLGTYTHGAPGNTNAHNAQGCVVDSNGHVWVAHSLFAGRNTVGHLDAAGTWLGDVTVGSGPTGVAVDANGKVWATNYTSRTVSRIDPALAGGVGAVDLTTVDIGGNLYNYSDMTGSTLFGAPDNGSWTVVYDSGSAGTNWGFVTWTASTPGDSSLTVEVRSSEDGSSWSAWENVSQGVDLTVPDGRFLQVRVIFSRASTGESPILFDLTISTSTGPKDVSDIRCTMSDDQQGIPNQILNVEITNAYPSIDYYCDIDIHGTGSVPVHISDVTLDDGTGQPPLPAGTTLELEACRFVPNGGQPPGGTLPSPLGAQLHASDRVYCTLHVHLPNAAQQDTTYRFSGSVTANQYNEP
jgi:sugar lactone lactonase YvrE